ncbi:MAG: hypothetical protein KF886_13480 [Candidatus Hydrogenedentes bacterium]|nr:hypothetical protein [Candidatus Hydrogenedentota bacterium]
MRLCCIFVTFFLLSGPFAGAAGLEDRISRAGNAPSDAARLLVLQELASDPNLDDSVRRDAARLAEEVDRYINNPRTDYFSRPVLDTEDYDFGIAADSPLYPLTHLYRARMLIWVTMEYGGYWKDPAVRRARLDQVRGIFEQAHEAFPAEPLARMYLGEPVPPPSAYPAPADAPAWAVAQREGIERLTDIIHWWIDHRQQADGQYGGDWGDDCEMWRFWPAILMGFEDAKVRAAQEKLSRGLLSQKHMQGGYTDHVYDVEHTAEDSSDVLTPMLHLDPDSAEWRERSMRLVELAESLWMGRNERGQLQFKSTYFSVDQVDESPKRACDTVYHPRALQPVTILWQRTRDPGLTRLFTDWMDTWADAAAREERGKPAGVIPSAIHWPSGTVGGTGANWWDPENHTNDPLYVFPSAMSQMTHTLLLAWHITGDDKYLAPVRSMAALRLKYTLEPPATEPAPGSEAWCAMKMGDQSSVLSKYRLLSGSTEFDALLAGNAPYAQFRFRGEKAPLVSALERTATALGTNFPGFTSEVRYTDRVLRFPTLYGANGMYPEAVEGIESPDPMLLYATITGDPGTAGYFPLNAVRWKTPPRNIAALVTDSSPDGFEARMYHFGPKPRAMGAEFYLLREGVYQVRIGDETQALDVTGPRAEIAFTLPPRETVVLRVELL